ncbi:MAG: AMP-binding protein [Clostridia bacterium]|nr:AMP-binding protein [Clostridia bacterium]
MKDFYVPDLRELLDNSAEKFGDKTFIKYFDGNTVIEKSYKKVRDDSLAVCRWLIHNSVCNKHIAIAGRTSYNFIIYFFAVLLSGNVAVPFDPQISVKDAIKLFDNADIDIILHEDEFGEGACEIMTALPRICETINLSDDARFNSIIDMSYPDDLSGYGHRSVADDVRHGSG